MSSNDNEGIEDFLSKEPVIGGAMARSIINAMSQGVSIIKVLYDSKGEQNDYFILAVNPAYEAQTGLAADQVVGKRVHEFLSVVEPTWYDLYGEVVRTQKAVTFEEYNASLDRWFRVDASPLPEKDTLVAVFEDITERKKAEEALSEANDTLENKVEERTRDLKESEERFRLLIEDAPESIGISREGVLVYVNSKHLKMHGYEKADELIGRSFLDLIAPQDRRNVELWDLSLMKEEHEPIERELMGLRRDGTQFPIHVRVVSIGLQEGAASVAFVTDITERKRVEKALRESEQKYRGLFENLEEAVSIFKEIRNEEGKMVDALFIDVNPATCKQVSKSCDELVGRTFNQVFGEGVADPYIAYVEEMKAKGGPLVKTYNFGPNNRHYLNLYVPLSDDTYLISTMDVTEIKMAQLRAEELAMQLQRSNADLELFAYIASHDLQEPLRMVTSYLGLLEKKFGNELNPQAKEFVKVAAEGSLRMKELIDDLLQYSRIDSSPTELQKVDMNVLAKTVLEDLTVSIDEAGAELIIDQLPTIYADETQMKQVLTNLVANAIKFIDGNPMIKISAITYENEFVFSVEDNGIGIDPKYSDKLFKMFSRLHTKEEYPGTGIGLAISKKIVERHGGRIWFESEPGKGTTFFFTLPTR